MLKWLTNLSGTIKLGAVMGAVIVAMGLGFKFYYDRTEKQIDQLEEEALVERIRADSAVAALDKMEEDIIRQAANLRDLNRNVNRIREETSKLGNLLAEHDLARLAREKPLMIERRANAATAQVLDNLELITDPGSYDEWKNANAK